MRRIAAWGAGECFFPFLGGKGERGAGGGRANGMSAEEGGGFKGSHADELYSCNSSGVAAVVGGYLLLHSVAADKGGCGVTVGVFIGVTWLVYLLSSSLSPLASPPPTLPTSSPTKPHTDTVHEQLTSTTGGTSLPASAFTSSCS